ncbi:fatty acid desaturase [Paraburkholderia fungorum]|uniref:fatty acid desaturase n=1 Tax=Paraburkholderia fungorum TaxID=134537 RepID=UPI001C1F1929|nr:fatty acid desaturase [Paraburkholderia fungorum]MBU7442670.1 fatty acid desaturase [Paraburkholderia fungorum]
MSLTLPIGACVWLFDGHPWLFVMIVLFAVPVLDAMIGRGAPVSGQAIEETAERQVPCWFALTWTCAIALGGYRAAHAPVVELIGLIVGCGVLSATAMAHLHELTHRPGKIWRLFSDLAFIIAGYPHYRVAHQLHHEHVGDPKFGSTASVGMSVWRHVGRSYTSALKSSFEQTLSQHNGAARRLFQNAFVGALLLGAAMMLHLWRVAIFYVGYAAVSVFIVEAVGYMQHYGFDRYPQPGAATSWDVNFWLSNCLLVNNGFHGSHHQDGRLAYQGLVVQGATLPGGYFQMLWLTLAPPLWFSVMDRRVRVLLARQRRQDMASKDQLTRDGCEIL